MTQDSKGRDERSASARSHRKWSQHVSETSDAMTLQQGVFKGTPRQIAQSLKRSAERSRRRKTDPFRSAMSMLNFYINRAGNQLSASRKKRLEAAKAALRQLFHKPLPRQPAHSR